MGGFRWWNEVLHRRIFMLKLTVITFCFFIIFHLNADSDDNGEPAAIQLDYGLGAYLEVRVDARSTFPARSGGEGLQAANAM